MTAGSDAIVPSRERGRPDSAGSVAAGNPQTRARLRRIAIAGGIGTIVEYYDYALYGYVAAIIAPLFFPHENPVAALLPRSRCSRCPT